MKYTVIDMIQYSLTCSIAIQRINNITMVIKSSLIFQPSLLCFHAYIVHTLSESWYAYIDFGGNHQSSSTLPEKRVWHHELRQFLNNFLISQPQIKVHSVSQTTNYQIMKIHG